MFRIDHDEKFNQTTHLQYQLPKNLPWIGFNWRYDSGLVAGAVPFGDGVNPVDTSGLTPDQQFQAGTGLRWCLCNPNHANQLRSRCESVPRLSVQLEIPKDTSARYRERRPQSTARCPTQPV